MPVSWTAFDPMALVLTQYNQMASSARIRWWSNQRINNNIFTPTPLAQQYYCLLTDVSNNSHLFSEDDEAASLQSGFAVCGALAEQFHGWTVHCIFHTRMVSRRCVFGCVEPSRYTGWRRDRSMCICMVALQCEFARVGLALYAVQTLKI